MAEGVAMRFAIVFAVLAGCSSPVPLCSVERDGVEVVRVDRPAEGTVCGVFRFGDFINVQVEQGAYKWKASVPYDAIDATESKIIWVDDYADCGTISASATWHKKYNGFDFSVTADCGGLLIDGRFLGTL